MQKTLILLALTAAAAFGQAGEWTIDTAHTTTGFAVRHMMVSTVRGVFGKTTGTVSYDAANPAATKINVSIDAASINTAEPKRDDHLRSADFFDVAKYPTITFVSKKAAPAGQGKIKVTGDLTMHGVTKEVTLDVEGPSPAIKLPNGMTKTGATATGKLNRRDFGLTWNRALEAGGVTVGEEVAITIDVELNKK